MALNCTASQGFQGKLAIMAGANTTWLTQGEMLEILSESITKTTGVIDTAGLRGSIMRSTQRHRDGVSAVGGEIMLNPSPRDMNVILPRLLDTSTSTWTTKNFESIAAKYFHVLIDKVGDVFQYTNCLCPKVVIRGSEGGIIEMVMSVIATDETTSPQTTFESLNYPATLDSSGTVSNSLPYMFYDSVLTLNGTVYQMYSFELTIEYMLDVKYRNSQTISSVCPTDRVITLKVSLPYYSGSPNTVTLNATNSAITGSLNLAVSTFSTLFSFTNLKRVQTKTPSVPGRSEVLLDLEYHAYGIPNADSSSVVPEMTVVNDVT